PEPYRALGPAQACGESLHAAAEDPIAPEGRIEDAHRRVRVALARLERDGRRRRGPVHLSWHDAAEWACHGLVLLLGCVTAASRAIVAAPARNCVMTRAICCYSWTAASNAHRTGSCRTASRSSPRWPSASGSRLRS